METTKTQVERIEDKEKVDTYLGYSIDKIAGWYLAMPQGWGEEVLEAPSLPELRRKIWRWWHQLPERV